MLGVGSGPPWQFRYRGAHDVIDIRLYSNNYSTMIEKLFPNSYSAVLAELRRRLEEPPPTRVQIISGPRQVGKTHLLRQIERTLGNRAIYAAADAPAAALPGWWEAQ
jgi:predicted AAA+ superfamily ATPase